jgi:hypothetical protein
MINEEAQKILDSMRNVMSENLTGEAKGLFEAIMKIADERDELRETVERQNLEIMAQKDARDFDAEITNDVNEIAVKLLKKLKEKNEIINRQNEELKKIKSKYWELAKILLDN